MMKKTICVFLSAVFVLCALVSCTGGSETLVMTCNGFGITQKQYDYWLSYYKTTFLATFEEYGVIEGEYTEDFWLSQTEGEYLWDMTRQKAEAYMQKLTVCLYLYDHYGLGDIDGASEQIKISVDECIADDVAAIGSRKALNKALAVYELNIDGLEEIYEIEIKRTMVEEYLFGEGGEQKVTDGDVEAYYKDNYVRVKHVLVNTVDKYVLDEDGERIIDPSTGYYKTEKLTENEVKEKKELAQSVLEKAQGGEDFEKLISEYNEDEGMTYYTDGYFLTEESAYEKAFLDAALTLEVGGIKSVESAHGIHIIKKYALDDGAYEKSINENFFTDLEGRVLLSKKDALYASYEVESTVSLTSDAFCACPLMDEALL